MNRLGAIRCLVFAMVAMCAARAQAAVMFSEDFSSGTLPATMEYTAKFVAAGQPEVNPGGPIFDLSAGNARILAGEFNRQYIQTVGTDYGDVDFVYEATVTGTGLSDWSAPFVGMGAGGADPNYYGEPLQTARMDASLWFNAGAFRIHDNSTPGTASNVPSANATHRIRMSWDAAAKTATYALDLNYTGGALVPDRIFSQGGSNNGFETASTRLCLGGGS